MDSDLTTDELSFSLSTMKCMSVLFGFFLVCSSYAQEPFPSSVEIMGRGVQNSETQEIVLVACTGDEAAGAESKCDQRRLVSIKKNQDGRRSASWLGSAFPELNQVQVKQALLDWYSEEMIEDIFRFFSAPRTSVFTDQSGWNWSESPLELKPDKFKTIVAHILYYAAVLENTTSGMAVGRELKKPRSKADMDDIVQYISQINQAVELGFSDEKIQKREKRVRQKEASVALEEQGNLLDCVEKIVLGNYGGYAALDVATRLLSPLVSENGLSKDTDQLAKTTEECLLLKGRLHAVKKSKLDQGQLYKLYFDQAYYFSGQKQKVKSKLGLMIFSLKYPSGECRNKEISAQAAAPLGVKIGFQVLRCELSNGQVRRYIGPILGIAGGFGAAAIVGRSAGDPGISHRLYGTGAFSATSTDNIVYTGLGSVPAHENKPKYSLNAAGVGYLTNVDWSAGARFFNGKRNWGKLVSLLE